MKRSRVERKGKKAKGRKKNDTTDIDDPEQSSGEKIKTTDEVSLDSIHEARHVWTQHLSQQFIDPREIHLKSKPSEIPYVLDPRADDRDTVSKRKFRNIERRRI